MKRMLSIAFLLIFAGGVSADQLKFTVVENKTTVVQKFTVVSNNCKAVGGAVNKSPFVKGTTTPTTTVPVAGTKVPPVVVRGSNAVVPDSENTITSVPLMGLDGGITTSNCPNGNCPNQSYSRFRRR